jgi:hypothetical protein
MLGEGERMSDWSRGYSTTGGIGAVVNEWTDKKRPRDLCLFCIGGGPWREERRGFTVYGNLDIFMHPSFHHTQNEKVTIPQYVHRLLD